MITSDRGIVRFRRGMAGRTLFAALAALVILRRAGNFAFTNPGMEALFTVVPREDKYKAKSFIETFVCRGGDQMGAWTFALLAVWLARQQSALAPAGGRRDPTAVAL